MTQARRRRRPTPPFTGPASHAVLLGLLLAAAPASGGAQRTRTFTACTPDALMFCAELRLTASAGTFEVALRTLGAAAQPGLPTSLYNLVLGTGAGAAAAPRTTSVTPVALGGAVVSDASPWELFDSGDALFLSALTDRGVGGCVAGVDVGGFGQAATTCGAGQFVAFLFTPTAAIDPDQVTMLDLEAVALTNPPFGASCGAPGAACVITAGTAVVPEPASGVLVAAGLGVLAVVFRRRAEA